MIPSSTASYGPPLEVTIAGEEVQLYPERGLFWPDKKMLFVADVHLGKSGTFRHFGLPIPETAAVDLAVLSRLLQRTKAETLVVLGDLTHHRVGIDDRLIGIVADWRREFSRLQIALVAGNHDRHLTTLPKAWEIENWEKEVTRGPFLLRHEPLNTDDPSTQETKGFVLAGHLHPCFALLDAGRQRTKCAGFWRRKNELILPAFSQFTDGMVVQPNADDSAYVLMEGQIVEIPLAAS